MSASEACGVCGRTILAGERTRGYLDRGGARRSVCELCRTRAERLGWAGEEVGPPPAQAPVRGRRAFGGLWRKRRERPGAEPASSRSEPPADPSPDPAAAGAGVGRVEREPAPSPLGPYERAVIRFNASEAARTVAGLMRSLGEPWVSVGAAAGSPGEVRITVAWELTWYQWCVDLDDELRGVFQLDRGSELEQLDGSARQWNASAGGSGRLLLGRTSRTRREPVA